MNDGGSPLGNSEQKALIAGFTDFVVAAAHHDWSPERLASELRARSIASPETVAVCEAFWRSTQLKARAALAQRSFWSPTALDVAWRVEIEAGSSAPRPARPSTDASGGDASGAPAAEPHAVIELTTGARRLPASSTATPTSEGSSTIAAGSSQLRFRADRESLLGLVESLRAAEAAASRLSE